MSSALCVQTGSGTHPASYAVGTEGSFPGGKVQQGHNADHSPPSSGDVKKEWELHLLSPQAPPWRVAGQIYFICNCLMSPETVSLYFQKLLVPVRTIFFTCWLRDESNSPISKHTQMWWLLWASLCTLLKLFNFFSRNLVFLFHEHIRTILMLKH
jgi:hypothetical protein